MILLTLALLAFGTADLLRWSPDPVRAERGVTAGVAATALAAAAAGLAGFEKGQVLLIVAGTAVVLAVWIALDSVKSRARLLALPWALVVLLAAFAAAGVPTSISGSLDDWYSDLPFSFTDSVPVDQFALGVGAALFLLATANRIVRLVLEAAGTPVAPNEAVLRGGRLLGPMERLVVAALVLSGDATGAAIIITAKGLLRLPDIRARGARTEQDDEVTEYLLIGTFSSLLLAATLAVVVLAGA